MGEADSIDDLPDGRDNRVAHVRAEQTRLYGAPLGTLVTELTGTYGMSQRRLARILDISAPMVTNLAVGNRIKIGNPSAVQRMQRLLEMASDVRAGRISAENALDQIEAEQTGAVLTRTSERMRRQGAQDVQMVLRWAASADELTRAADLLDRDFPALAEVVRTYGLGRSGDAAAHFQNVVAT